MDAISPFPWGPDEAKSAKITELLQIEPWLRNEPNMEVRLSRLRTAFPDVFVPGNDSDYHWLGFHWPYS